jgi:4-diphosphocytidyl-2-C-methyl-D-erythritol kinase
MSAGVRSVRVRAPAKINLTLRVLGIRADGYHELRTTFQSLALHDTLTFTAERGPFTITSDDERCPNDATNLVWQAAARLWAASGRRGRLADVRVHLRKRIPMQAGLGGGSSDAAATLRALRLLWRVSATDGELAAIARGLGADVAFFLEGGTVLGVERGDLLFALQDAPSAWVVLSRPGFGVSTADAYRWWDQAHVKTAAALPVARGRAPEYVNDLEGPVVARHPAVGKIVRTLRRFGARYAAMSGSGSAVFGLFDDREVAAAAAGALQTGSVETWLTRTIRRRESLRLSAPRPVAH